MIMLVHIQMQKVDEILELPVPYEHLSAQELNSGRLVHDGAHGLLINEKDIPATGLLREALECVTLGDFLQLCNVWDRRDGIIEVQKRREAAENRTGG